MRKYMSVILYVFIFILLFNFSLLFIYPLSLDLNSWVGLFIAVFFVILMIGVIKTMKLSLLLQYMRMFTLSIKATGIFVLTATLFFVQIFIFVKAPQSGHGFDLALGYFLVPTILRITEAFIKEKEIGHMVEVSFLCIVSTVAFHFFSGQLLSWVFYSSVISISIYEGVRIRFNTNNIAAMLFDCILLFPLFIYMIYTGGGGYLEAWSNKLFFMISLISLSVFFVLYFFVFNINKNSNIERGMYILAVLVGVFSIREWQLPDEEKILSYLFVFTSVLISCRAMLRVENI